MVWLEVIGWVGSALATGYDVALGIWPFVAVNA